MNGIFRIFKLNYLLIISIQTHDYWSTNLSSLICIAILNFRAKMYGKLLYCNSLLINESENIIKNDNINLFTHHLHYLRFT